MNRSVFLLTFANFVAIGGGFLRDVAVAYYFGTGAEADAFTVTFLLIEGIAVLAVYGLGSTMVPVVGRFIGEGVRGAEYSLMESLCLWAVLVSIPFVLAGIFWPAGLVGLLGTGFSPEQRRLLASLLRISTLSVPLLLTGGILGGVLQAKADYVTPVLGRALFSISVGATVVIAAGRVGVVSTAIGILLGALIQFLVQGLLLVKKGWHPRIPAWRQPALHDALAIGLPTLLALVSTNVLMGNAQRSIASGLPEGSLAAVNYAQRILGLVASFSGAIGVVSLTELSVEYGANRLNSGRTSAILKRSIESGLFLLTPIAILLFVYSDSLAAVLYQRGQFGPSSVALTARCLRWFSLAIIPSAVLSVLLRTYTAIWRPWATVWISLFWAVSTILGSAVLLPEFQTVAIPAAYSLGMFLATVISVVGLWNTLERSFFKSVSEYAVRMAVCGGLPAVLLILIRGSETAEPFSPFAVIQRTLPAAVLYIGIFVLLCIACRDPHISLLWNLGPMVRLRKQIATWL